MRAADIHRSSSFNIEKSAVSTAYLPTYQDAAGKVNFNSDRI